VGPREPTTDAVAIEAAWGEIDGEEIEYEIEDEPEVNGFVNETRRNC
jgi:hypothetical protein